MCFYLFIYIYIYMYIYIFLIFFNIYIYIYIYSSGCPAFHYVLLRVNKIKHKTNNIFTNSVWNGMANGCFFECQYRNICRARTASAKVSCKHCKSATPALCRQCSGWHSNNQPLDIPFQTLLLNMFRSWHSKKRPFDVAGSRIFLFFYNRFFKICLKKRKNNTYQNIKKQNKQKI